MKLKNREHGIPGGFQFIQAETGWDTDKIPEIKGRSFVTVVNALVKHRTGNSWLAQKHGWNLDWDSVANEVDHYNALRMKANPRWHHFIDDAGGSSASAPFRFLAPDALRNAVGVAAKTVAGVGVLLRWLGSGGKAVPKEQAEKRAAVCTICPMNQPGSLSTWFTETASAEILKVFGIMSDLKLSTSMDEKLGVCRGCLCPLKSKVWAPLPHILAEMSEKVKGELNQDKPRCWILTEAG